MRWHHDVSTDAENPSPFVALRAARLACANGVEYSGLNAAEHRARYPDLHTQVLTQAPALIFEAALAAANAMQWQIAIAAAESEGEGRIEATATTRLLRFKDDVVIRIRAHNSGATLDIRSASRIGKSDLGANARRIRRFLLETKNRLKSNT